MRRAGKILNGSSASARSARRRGPAFIFTARSWADIRKRAWSPPPVARIICSGVIKKHELTRPDKEDDRVRHIEALARRPARFSWFIAPTRGWMNWRRNKPGRRRTRISRRATGCAIRRGRCATRSTLICVRRTFADIPFLYIADGHHRSAAAARVYQSRKGAGGERVFSECDFPG